MASCPLPTPARVTLTALGDFPTSGNTSEFLSLSAQDVKLSFPLDTLALEATVTADSTEQTFIGYSERNQDDLDFLLWPLGSACELSRNAGYPRTLGGQALGYASTSGLLMIAGSSVQESSDVVGALTFDARTGENHLVDPRVRAVLSVPRAFASVSDFGGKVLVAGGDNPISDQPSLNDSAELYDPSLPVPAFERDLLKLAVPRSHHAALTLQSGEVALIGGRAPNSDASSYVEVLTPDTGSSTLVESLWLGRSQPVALRLSDGRLFIAGGVDSDGHPVAGLEWRSADATSRLDAPFDGSIVLPARYDRAFAALPGGAVLAVGGCEDRPPELGEDCAAWCTRGCPPKADAPYDAYWISAEGDVQQISFSLSAGQPVLLPGSDGRPWLIANDADQTGRPKPGSRALYRFDPWKKSFIALAANLGLPAAGDAPRFVATGLDAFVWLTEAAGEPVLSGVRLGSRSIFSNDIELVRQRDSEDLTLPAHLAPDRASDSGVDYDSALGSLNFAQAVPGAAVSCVWIADAEYANFQASIDFTSVAAPSLRLGAQSFADPNSSNADSACQLPQPNDGAESGTLLVERAGNHVSMTIRAAHSECTTSSERLPIAVCGSELGPVRIKLLTVKRAG